MVEINIWCPTCEENAFHIDKISNGNYIIRCMSSSRCQREIRLEEDTLADLKK